MWLACRFRQPEFGTRYTTPSSSKVCIVMQESNNSPLLTDLCAICHTDPIKYTCPRCGIHTCSLPCVKRHKAWAQCSGIRDPAAYKKRSDLATPSAVDQDFNFITSVERSLQRADELVSDKGIHLAPSGIARGSHGTKRKFDVEVEERGIRLIKAPQGLSRSKQNKSHWAGQHKCLMWTTEWLYFDGEKRIHNVTELRTVGEAFVNIFGKNTIRKKRKRSDAQSTAAPVLPAEAHNEHAPTDAVQGSATSEAKDEGLQAESKDDNPAEDGQGVVKSAVTSDNAAAQVPEVSQLCQDLHFYLLKPNTVSKHKCLIPVSPTSTLQDVLRDKTILEFPTFYIRQEAPENLPEPFITEEKYDQVYGSEVTANLPTYAPPDNLDETEKVSSLPNIDEKTVLEVLQKDLAG
ncbi:hypothetical protein ABEF92_008265 [Exophiala dermatitidis]|uniref:Box C/D snoRNA protein 1 n=1 Tax=Exophiala dermatitidis (strain ATCC 34100 / CBS 525.76 / NIH/UT8656) TaxID=858893 RepID=H6BS68_EXODN|nr:uncharacterized protein HMPREF1120_02298 [Exophiala dermatitidis NIH/UT8656]EHY54122.1 hypothetical protein HMPREF1120_02298 [Exophiala dermatitidis NIH/UT8656]